MKKQIIQVLIILAAIIILNTQMNTQMDTKSQSLDNGVTSNVIKEPIDTPVLNIDSSEVTECCTFVDERGNEKTCYAMKRFSCDYCDSVC